MHLKYGNSPSWGVVDTTVVSNIKFLQYSQAEQLNKNLLLSHHHDLLTNYAHYDLSNYFRTSVFINCKADLWGDRGYH